MQIGVSKEEFEVHLQSAKHQRNKNLRELSSLSSSAETVFSVPPVSLETNGNRDTERTHAPNHNGVLTIANHNLGSTLSMHSRSSNISATNSQNSDYNTKRIVISNQHLLAMPSESEIILEESVAFIETNIPFADPVVYAGNLCVSVRKHKQLGFVSRERPLKNIRYVYSQWTLDCLNPLSM